MLNAHAMWDPCSEAKYLHVKVKNMHLSATQKEGNRDILSSGESHIAACLKYVPQQLFVDKPDDGYIAETRSLVY
jgi:hypothetical protein